MAPPLLLLVEDAPDIAFLVERFARRGGHEVAHRPDVASAWDFLRGRRPDLVLLDLNLPGENGLELCRRVRATPDLADLPIALFGQPDRTGDIVAGLRAGVDYVLSKDLLGRPPAWEQRLHELLAFVARPARPAPTSQPTAPLAAEALAALHQALRHPVLRRLDPDILEALLVRTVNQAARAGRTCTAPERWDAWLRAERSAVTLSAAAQEAPSDALLLLLSALFEQLWCILGEEAVAPFRAALMAACPLLTESLARCSS